MTGVVHLPSGTEMMPGDNIEMEVELIVPIAMEETRFIREGGRTVGAGVVAAIIE